MIKSPEQWAKAFKRLSNSDSEVVSIELNISSIIELEKMMIVLSENLTVDEIKSLIDEV